MKNFWLMVAMVGVVGVAVAAPKSVEPRRLPNPPLVVNAMTLAEHGDEVQSVTVEVLAGNGAENPMWAMSFTHVQVLLGKLQGELPPPIEPTVLAKAPKPTPGYKGLRVVMTTVDGKKFEALTVANGRIGGKSGLVREDPGRGLEYWLFSTARVKRDLLLGAQVLPVITFEQCRILGMQIVETEPRQCILPDKTLLLETLEKPTVKSVKVTDFDGCLKDGQALIATFPRRCMVAGGRVFVEPPRLEEAPADAPLAPGVEGTSASMVVSPTMVSPTMVDNPLLGTYAVSESLVSGTVLPVEMPIEVSGSGVLSSDTAMLFRIAPAAGPLEESGLRGWWNRQLQAVAKALGVQ